MQHHVISYDEVLIKFEDGTEGLVYFEPSHAMTPKETPSTVYRIYRILDTYITTGLITKGDMIYANEVWNDLRDKAR